MKKINHILLPAITILMLATIIIWQLFFSQKINYYIVCVCLLIFSMLPLLISFEVKSISAREITLVATMIALAVVSRAIFYLIPQVKPIASVIIICAVCLGAERGYLAGVFSAFISNMIFGQGFWTPFQMAGLGLVGLLAGLIFKKIKPNRINLAIFGFILSFIVYGCVVDISTVLMMYADNISLKAFLSVYASGAVFNLSFGISTAVFLFIFGEEFIKKINRINTKFNIISNKKTDNR